MDVAVEVEVSSSEVEVDVVEKVAVFKSDTMIDDDIVAVE